MAKTKPFTLDNKPALVIVDIQQGTIGMPLLQPAEQLIRNNQMLITAFRGHSLPIVYAIVDGVAPGRTETFGSGKDIQVPEGYADYVPGLEPQDGDIIIRKQTWGSFTNTDLHKQLEALDVSQVVLTGIVTSLGVESTARSASEHGYNVLLATDAMSDTSDTAQTNSLEWVFPKLGEQATTRQIVDMLTI